MEDAIDVVVQFECGTPTEFFAVYDGHSGTQAVEFVKQHLPVTLCHLAITLEASLGIDEVLSETFRRTDEDLLKCLRQNPPQSQSPKETENSYMLSAGCVGCVVLIRGKRIHVANLGDCRAAVCCDGEIKLLTEDHRPEVNEFERERLKSLGVEVSSDGYLHGRIGVSRAFGDWAWYAEEKCCGLLCEPQVLEYEVSDDTEFMLLGCDGIFEKMTTKEAGQIVRRSLRTSSGDAKTAAESLVMHAGKRNGTDNLSALVVVFKAPAQEDTSRQAPRLFRKKFTLDELAAAQDPEAGAPPGASDATTTRD